MASFVIREFGGGDQGCVRSDQVDLVRVGQHPAIAGGGRSGLMFGAIQYR